MNQLLTFYLVTYVPKILNVYASPQTLKHCNALESKTILYLTLYIENTLLDGILIGRLKEN